MACLRQKVFGMTVIYILCCVAQDGNDQRGNRYCPGIRPIRISNPKLFYKSRNAYTDRLNTFDSNSTLFVRQRITAQCTIPSLRFFRSFDGECTNPARPFVGKAGTPFYSYWKNHDSKEMSGTGLRSAREISNIVLNQDDESVVDDNYKLRESATFFGQFLDHSIVLSSADTGNPDADRDIPVPSDDVRCDLSVIQFTRNVKANRRGKSAGPGWFRAINTVSSAVDLFGVYGDEILSQKLRSKSEGKMRYSGGNKRLLPLNDDSINEVANKMNAPSTILLSERKRFFIAGDSRSNENPQLTAQHTLWLRNHNRIAGQLALDFPDKRYDDDWLFASARRINQAEFQAVVYTEFLPALIGEELKPCPKVAGGFECFNQEVDAGVSDIFANAAFRVGHTMVGNFVNRVKIGLDYMPPLRLEDAFFSEASVIENDGIEPYLLGAIWNQAQKIDNYIVSALRIKLFGNTGGEDGVDLASLNIQRGRDTNLKSFAEVKKFFLGKDVNSFWDISSNENIVERLEKAYENPQEVELYVGMLCEDHAPGKPMGPTLAAIWKQEFERLRDGDYYFYQNIFKYSPELRSYKPLLDIIDGSGPKMRDILIYNTDIESSDLPANVWKM